MIDRTNVIWFDFIDLSVAAHHNNIKICGSPFKKIKSQKSYVKQSKAMEVYIDLLYDII